MPTVEELGSLRKRIEASAEHISELEEKIKLERERRNALIVEAVDQAGAGQAQVARWARLSQPSVLRVLAGASTD
ncbi:hypothetical protein QE364_003895 [Nocardioides zeae]|uniref:Uncharacterized protein n=1 Tax=Nocardioides zeae TaxID=1457234 RepID=A0ACC6IN51_9ACTN|nr:hypothetical protein [Nocardioides zeae]MDR6212164.1 hypothetical protein [Nocardioides zeae]